MAEHPPLPRLLHDASTPDTGVVLRWTADGVVVVVTGEVDLTCGPQLAAVSRALAGWVHRAVVDASGVTFVDVGGLRQLLALAPPGGSLLVLEPSAVLLRLVDLLHGSGSWPQELGVGPRERALVLRRPVEQTVEQPAQRRAVEPARVAPLEQQAAGRVPGPRDR